MRISQRRPVLYENSIAGQKKFQPLKDWDDASIFVMNQDTGGAIKGPARADLFCGNGAYAEFAAGHKNVHGKLFFLVLDPDQG